MLSNEKIGEAAEDTCEIALNYLKREGLVLGYKRFTNREGREDFEIRFSDGSILSGELKNHKTSSYWTLGQAAKYGKQIKGDGVKAILKSSSWFKPGARKAIERLGIRIVEFGEQILEVSAKAVSKLMAALRDLVQPRSSTNIIRSVVCGGVCGLFSVFSVFSCRREFGGERFDGWSWLGVGYGLSAIVIVGALILILWLAGRR